jgi:hypothetical protein
MGHSQVKEGDVYNCPNPFNNTFRHASWAKIMAVYNALCQGYDYVFYADSDCAFVSHGKKIEDLFEGQDKDVVFLNNHPHQDHMPCGGAFAVRNTKEAMDFLRQWYHCDDVPADVWASVLRSHRVRGDAKYGTYWEQDALWYIMSTNQGNSFSVHPTEKMFVDYPEQLVRHVCHFYSFDFRNNFFRDLVTEMEPLYGPYAHVVPQVWQIDYDTMKHVW